MHQLKHQALLMKEALLLGRIHEIGEILDFGFRQKQQMAEGITNAYIDNIYEEAKKCGGYGRKDLGGRRRGVYDVLLSRDRQISGHGGARRARRPLSAL